MAKTQTRRSVSLNAAMHKFLEEHCQNHRIAMSAYVHQALIDKLVKDGNEHARALLPLYQLPYIAIERRRRTMKARNGERAE
jgi:hypothetical protein